MKKHLLANLPNILLVLLLVSPAYSDTIARPTKSFGGTSFVDGVIPLASDFNGDINTVVNDYNGNITNVNIAASAAIAGSKILPNFTTNPDITNAAPCYKIIESDQAADTKRWDICVSASLWELRVVDDAGSTTRTPISVARATGNTSWFGKFILYNNAAPTDGQLLVGNTAGVRFDAATLTGTTNQVTVTNGAGTITLATPQSIHTGATPTFSSLTLSGLTANSFLYSGTAGLLTTTIAPTNGQLLVGSTGAAPVVAAITGTANQVTVTNGAGTITLSTPQSIAAASDVTFNSAILSANTASSFLYSDASKKVQSTSAPTNGQLLIGSTGVIPVVATITAGTNIAITNGAGSITVGVTGSVTGTLTAGTAVSLTSLSVNQTFGPTAHGLGARPKFFEFIITCTSADAGYSANDVLDVTSAVLDSSNNASFSILKDATNVTVTITNGTALTIPHFSTRAATAIDGTKWTGTLTPYKLN